MNRTKDRELKHFDWLKIARVLCTRKPMTYDSTAKFHDVSSLDRRRTKWNQQAFSVLFSRDN
jgi:hypothetical protein